MFTPTNNPAIKFLKLTFALFLATTSIIALTVVSFKSIGQSTIDKLNKDSGTVAGAQTQNNSSIVDNESISKDIPIIPDSDIISNDNQGKKTSVILESNHSDKEINIFYDNFLLSNGWKKTLDGEYIRKNQKFTLNINNGIVQITLE